MMLQCCIHSAPGQKPRGCSVEWYHVMVNKIMAWEEQRLYHNTDVFFILFGFWVSAFSEVEYFNSNVCVWNISIDVKLVPGFFLVAGGCRECHGSAANADGYDIDPGRWIEVRASIFMSTFCDGLWLTRRFQQTCRRGFKLFLHSCAVGAIWDCGKLHVEFIFRCLNSTFTWAMATYTGYGGGKGIWHEL